MQKCEERKNRHQSTGAAALKGRLKKKRNLASKMPRQFGPFMVPSTSSVQHQKKVKYAELVLIPFIVKSLFVPLDVKVKKETNEREERLEAWKREKAERTERLRQSQKKTQQQHARCNFT